MHNLLFDLGTRRFAGLWLLLITSSAVILIRFALYYRGDGERLIRANVVLFALIASPAGIVLLSELLGTESIVPGPLVWLVGLAGGELVVMGGYPLAGLSLLLGVVVLLKSSVSARAKIAGIVASLANCLLIALYLYIASRPSHW